MNLCSHGRGHPLLPRKPFFATDASHFMKEWMLEGKTQQQVQNGLGFEWLQEVCAWKASLRLLRLQDKGGGKRPEGHM